jgi:DNA (cytosine-5)-methyltransferase 1
MQICYNKLWKLLIDKGMTRTQLRKTAHIGTNVLAKMGKNEFVSMEILAKICEVLECDIGDICEFIKKGL